MNVFRFELRRVWLGAAVWTLVLLGLMAGLIIGALPVFFESRTSVEAMLANFPPEFSAVFGLALDDIFSFGGFYSFGFLYYSLFGAIMASAIGLDLFSREKREKCMDFLMTKPRSRSRLFTEKFLVALLLILLSNVLFIAESLVLYRAYAPAPLHTGYAALAASALLFTELLFLAISMFGAVFVRKVRSVSGAATAIGFGGFILSALQSILEEEKLRYVTPFQYFDPAKAFSEGSFDTPYVITAVLLTVALLLAAYGKYTRSDIPAL